MNPLNAAIQPLRKLPTRMALFFTAGINNESDGLFGTNKPVNGLDGDEE